MEEIDKKIITGLAENSMSIRKTADRLHYHRNTITYHIEKIRDVTGLDARRFHDLVKLIELIGEKK